MDLILEIAGPLKAFVEEQGGEFRFSLVTNGSLLTREMVEKLTPAGLYAAKVTVDGPPDEHNRLRPFKSGAPSFDVILDNVRACCDLIRIGFGGNYTRDNFGGWRSCWTSWRSGHRTRSTSARSSFTR